MRSKCRQIPHSVIWPACQQSEVIIIKKPVFEQSMECKIHVFVGVFVQIYSDCVFTYVRQYRVSRNEWTPHNTKYGLFVIILCKSYEIFSPWLGLDVANK